MSSHFCNERLLPAIFFLLFTLAFTFTTAGPLNPAVRVRNPTGISQHDVTQAVRREIAVASNSTKGINVKKSTPLDRSWDSEVLLKIGSEQTVGDNSKSSLEISESIEVQCVHCYIKGTATGQLSVGRFNTSGIIQQSLSQVDNDFQHLINKVENYLEECFDDAAEDTLQIVEDIAVHNDINSLGLAWPTFDYSLNMDVPAIPEAKLRFSFDDLELYMKMDATLSLGSTYTLNLYTSDTPLGIEISTKLDLGIIFTVDLILDVEGKIDISSGFHIKVDDGLGIDIALFGNEASEIVFNGGQFEFLPVTVESAGIVFKAILRVGAHAGFDLNTPDTNLPDISILGYDLTPDVGVGVGVDVAIFADVAEFVTDVKYNPQHQDCELKVEQAYTFGLGAGVGATLSFGTTIWGPTPSEVVPIFYTTLASACAVKASPVSTSIPSSSHSMTAVASKRDAMSTATITTEVTYSGVKCMSTGLVNCPVSLQTTSKNTATTTFTTVVPSGMDEDHITLATYHKAVPTVVPFGDNAVKLPTSSGKPESYVPPKPTPTGQSVIGNVVDELDHKDKMIIGLSVGLGVPFLLVLAAAVFFVHKRRKSYSAVPINDRTSKVDGPYGHQVSEMIIGSPARPHKAAFHISEVRQYGNEL